ncbi:MAG: dUTP diphosphatase [Proteobacteria bacterium]|nr:dUTP diphosphatase [Pseudomonadota bacterium]
MLPSLPVRKLDPRATLPTRAHPDDAGLDLYALEDMSIGPRAGALGRTGIALSLPAAHVGLVADRSSMAKRGLKTAGGIIDAGYRGEIGVVLWNLTDAPQTIAAGERFAQLLILPVATPAPTETKELTETSRGAGGFGSTGR